MKILSLAPSVQKVAFALCDAYATPVAQQVKQLILTKRWDDLATFKVKPSSYTSPETYFADVACASLLSKYEPLPTSFDRKAVAREAFYEAERNCYRTNQRLAPFLNNTYCVEDEGVYQHIVGIRKELKSILGPSPLTRRLLPLRPTWEYGKAQSNPEGPLEFATFNIGVKGRFGPGSTFGDKGVYTTIPDKMSSHATLTNSAKWFLWDYSSTAWAEANRVNNRSVEYVRGNRFVTVPKNCKTDRGISIGASINLFYQLGYGRAIRDSLRRVGINLDTAQEVHRQVACDASKTGSYATIDLKQASDSIAANLVRLLLPRLWLEPMEDLREPMTEMSKGRWVLLEKFSAMGNGYTFELETAVFLAISMYCCKQMGLDVSPGKGVHVYGDDIIVPTVAAQSVIAVLRYLGLQTNEDKTFVEGPFRESCGGDYFNGSDVRPFHLKEDPNEPQKLIAMANGIWRMGHPDPRYNFRWDHIRRAWFLVLDELPSNIRRCRGPKDLGDAVIHDEPEFWETRTRSSRRYFRGYVPDSRTLKKVHRRYFTDEVVLASAVYAQLWTKDGFIHPRDAVVSYRRRWLQYS